jgi:hypothetical protein
MPRLWPGLARHGLGEAGLGMAGCGVARRGIGKAGWGMASLGGARQALVRHGTAGRGKLSGMADEILRGQALGITCPSCGAHTGWSLGAPRPNESLSTKADPASIPEDVNPTG